MGSFLYGSMFSWPRKTENAQYMVDVLMNSLFDTWVIR